MMFGRVSLTTLLAGRPYVILLFKLSGSMSWFSNTKTNLSVSPSIQYYTPISNWNSSFSSFWFFPS